MLRISGIVLLTLVGAIGCGDPCGELKKVDCSKSSDKAACENYKEIGVKANERAQCTDMIENNSSITSARGK